MKKNVNKNNIILDNKKRINMDAIYSLLHQKYFLNIITCIFACISIANMIWYIIDPNNPMAPEPKLIYPGSIWVVLIFTALGTVIGMRSFIMILKMDKKFFPWSTLALSSWIIVNIHYRLWYSVLKLLVFFLIRLVQFITWNSKENFETKKNITCIKKSSYQFLILILFLAGGIAFGLGHGMAQISTESNFYNPAPYLDAVQFVFSIIGQFFMINKNIFYFIFALPSNIIIIYIHAVPAYQPITLFSDAFFTMILIVAFFNWYNQFKIKKIFNA